MISQKDKLYIFLSSLELSYKKCSEILIHYNDIQEFENALNKNDKFLYSLFGEKLSKIKSEYKNMNFESFEKYLKNTKTHYITIDDENYPECLLRLDNPPFLFYYRGDLKLIDNKCIGIVGSRKPTYYGQDITKEYTKILTNNDICIVSGMSYGIDKIAHEVALANHGKTIAVLGGGFNNIYPNINKNLAQQISSMGLLISEYYPDFQPKTYTFPARNRIIAAIGNCLFIPEASIKSGSLYTKDFALELGKDVYALPGNITNANCEGTNSLIKSGQALCVTCVEDILLPFGIEKINGKKKLDLTDQENLIYKFLLTGEKSFDEIQEFTKLAVQTLNTNLTTLQISGVVKKLPGNCYSV